MIPFDKIKILILRQIVKILSSKRNVLATTHSMPYIVSLDMHHHSNKANITKSYMAWTGMKSPEAQGNIQKTKQQHKNHIVVFATPACPYHKKGLK